MKLHHKGFEGEFSYSKEDRVWYGKLTNITDLVAFEDKELQNIPIKFEEAVDDYIQLKESTL